MTSPTPDPAVNKPALTDQQIAELGPLAKVIAEKVSTVPVRHCLGGTDQLVTELVLAVAAYMGSVLGPDAAVLAEVQAERERQDARWGPQNHPNGTGMHFLKAGAENARRECEAAFDAGRGTWRHVLYEEVHEALAEKDPAALRAELVQVAAVAAAWIAAIDRRATGGTR